MNPEHYDVVKQGKEAIDQWRWDNPKTELDLEKADLAEANLSHANLRRSKLAGANLSSASLIRASLGFADLTGVNLSFARMQESDVVAASLISANLHLSALSNANLTGANLSLADLRACHLDNALLRESNLMDSDMTDASLIGASLRSANLCRTRLSGTQFGQTVLSNVDLRLPIGVDLVNHLRPSEINNSTIQRLEGQITADVESFLRGCGYDRWEIEHMRLYDPALTAEQISEHLTTKVFPARTPGAFFLGGVFISYAHDDWGSVKKLYEQLRGRDITTYLDRHDFTAGSLEKNISRAIRINDQVIVVLSRHSLKSDWVWHEIASTLEKENDIGKDVLFPIRIDEECWKDQRNKERLMSYVKERVILDFSDPATFEENLNKLITGMKVNQ